jgi:AcrR family transcriptional regulator
MTTATTARREEEKELRRRAILDAARRVVGRDGVEKATMGRVAREARLSRALLYFYFRDQDDLWWALVSEGLSRLGDYFREAARRADDGLDALERIGWAYVRLSREHPVEWELLAHKEVQDLAAEDGQTEEAPHDELRDHRAACERLGSGIHQLMAEQVARGVEDGSVRADVGDPLTTALALWGATHGLLQIARMKESMLAGGYGISPDDYLEHGIRMLTRSMAA